MTKQTKKTEQQIILNNGVMQSMLTIPDEGLLVRLRIDGRNLVASFEEEVGQPGTALQMIAWALIHLRVDPILDEDHPFKVYDPGVVCGNSR